MTGALLAVKNPARAFSRLHALLEPEERQRLAWILYEGMLEVLRQAPAIDLLAAVSDDPAVLEHAARAGFVALAEEEQLSHSASVDAASRRVRALGIETLALLPIDTPLATPADIAALIARSHQMSGCALVLAPDHAGSGTNAMVRRPPDVIPSCFGPGSLDQHLRLAAERQVEVHVEPQPGLAFDLDFPGDVAAYLAMAHDHPAAEFLRRIGADERVRIRDLAQKFSG